MYRHLYQPPLPQRRMTKCKHNRLQGMDLNRAPSPCCQLLLSQTWVISLSFSCTQNISLFTLSGQEMAAFVTAPGASRSSPALNPNPRQDLSIARPSGLMPPPETSTVYPRIPLPKRKRNVDSTGGPESPVKVIKMTDGSRRVEITVRSCFYSDYTCGLSRKLGSPLIPRSSLARGRQLLEISGQPQHLPQQ
jgi:hypothetical protein